MLYRIFTEHKNYADILTIITQHFDGFTLIPATGLWQFEEEKSLIIEIEAEDNVLILDNVLKIIEAIKFLNTQESVLLQQIKTEATFV